MRSIVDLLNGVNLISPQYCLYCATIRSGTSVRIMFGVSTTVLSARTNVFSPKGRSCMTWGLVINVEKWSSCYSLTLIRGLFEMVTGVPLPNIIACCLAVFTWWCFASTSVWPCRAPSQPLQTGSAFGCPMLKCTYKPPQERSGTYLRWKRLEMVTQGTSQLHQSWVKPPINCCCLQDLWFPMLRLWYLSRFQYTDAWLWRTSVGSRAFSRR